MLHGPRGRGAHAAVRYMWAGEPMPGAEGLCHREPRVPITAIVTPVHRALFYMPWKLPAERQKQDYSTSCHNSGKVSTVQVCSSFPLVCWEGAEKI